MEKLRYDSLYKFIVSVGIVIMIIPFVIIHWLFTNNEIILIKEQEINELTNTAGQIVTIEQNYEYNALKNTRFYIIGMMFWVIIGAIIVLIGIKQWKDKVQKYEDQLIKLKAIDLESKIRPLSVDEKNKKIKEKITDSKPSSDDSKDSADISDKLKTNDVISLSSMEDNIYNLIERIFKNYKIFDNIKIGEEQYDCLALSKKDNIDYIFELKHYPDIHSAKIRMEDLNNYMLNIIINYRNVSHRFVRAVLLIVIDNFDDRAKLENRKELDYINSIEYNDKFFSIVMTDMRNVEKNLKQLYKEGTQ